MASVGRQKLLSKPVAPVCGVDYSKACAIILVGRNDSPDTPLSNYRGPQLATCLS
jgi:hypothetical protein